MPTLDRTRRLLSRQLADYEGLLATIMGVEHLESGPGRRRKVVVATDQRILIAWVRSPATPDVIPYARLTGARLIEDSDGVHLVLERDDGSCERIDALRDRASAEIFVSLVRTRCGSTDEAPSPVRRVRLVSEPTPAV